MMRHLEGRINDFLTLPDGSVISPMAVIGLDEDIPGISQFRMVQKKRDEISVELIVENSKPEDVVQASAAYLRDILGDGITLDIAVVEEITREKSGKMSVIKSLV